MKFKNYGKGDNMVSTNIFWEVKGLNGFGKLFQLICFRKRIGFGPFSYLRNFDDKIVLMEEDCNYPQF